jgi:hypothetical protein
VKFLISEFFFSTHCLIKLNLCYSSRIIDNYAMTYERKMGF